jgi:hypothetical protein
MTCPWCQQDNPIHARFCLGCGARLALACGAAGSVKSPPHRNPSAGETAEGYDREALALAGELGMRPLVAHCHFHLGTLFRKTDRQEQAREHLAKAKAMYREMDMRVWLDQAEAEMRQVE